MANCFCVGNIFPARDREIDRRRAVHKEIDERVMMGWEVLKERQIVYESE